MVLFHIHHWNAVKIIKNLFFIFIFPLWLSILFIDYPLVTVLILHLWIRTRFNHPCYYCFFRSPPVFGWEFITAVVFLISPVVKIKFLNSIMLVDFDLLGHISWSVFVLIFIFHEVSSQVLWLSILTPFPCKLNIFSSFAMFFVWFICHRIQLFSLFFFFLPFTMWHMHVSIPSVLLFGKLFLDQLFPDTENWDFSCRRMTGLSFKIGWILATWHARIPNKFSPILLSLLTTLFAKWLRTGAASMESLFQCTRNVRELWSLEASKM